LDTQDISVAAGVVSVAVAALGLLLTWYRREEKEERKSSQGRALSKRARVWLFAVVAVGITVLAAGGVVFTFKVGATDSIGATDSKSTGPPATLTATQYRGRLGKICSDANKKASQIDETRPAKTVFGLEITDEQDEVSAVRRLVPPNEMKAANANMIAVWDRRISLLSSIHSRWAQLSDSEKISELRETDQLAAKLAKLFRSLDVRECVM
jgi:hypothetical protein